jgi:CRISPR/Cas system-associated protein Cas10 (large subunit of type III CRISPR-Cas system)
MSYALADHLLSLMAGIDYYAIDAFARIGKYMQMPNHHSCDVCGASYLAFGAESDTVGSHCDVCRIFSEYR